jgi:hypothetical protein
LVFPRKACDAPSLSRSCWRENLNVDQRERNGRGASAELKCLHRECLSVARGAQRLPCPPSGFSPRMARSAFVPASVIGPVRGPRSASTSLSARVAGRRRSRCPSGFARVPRVEDAPTCVSLRRGLAMPRSYRPPIPNLLSQKNIDQDRI